MDTEQTETEATREDLIAAVRDAGGAESVDVVAEEAAAAAKAETAPAATPAEEEEPKIAAVLRAREEAFRKRQEAEDFVAQAREQAKADAERIRQEAIAEARKEAEAERQRLRDEYRANPTKAIRSLAEDPQDIIDAVAREGTPEWKEMRRLREELEETRQQAKTGASTAAEVKALREELQREREAAHVAQVRDQFLSQYASPEKTPKAYEAAAQAALFTGKDPATLVFERSDAIARDWQKKGLVLGQDFSFDDVANWLEREAKGRMLPNAPQQAGGVAASAAGNAPKVLASGSRTLSAATGSERRTSPKPIAEMTAEEERQALIEAAREARKTLRE
jgi:hypothetical protein